MEKLEKLDEALQRECNRKNGGFEHSFHKGQDCIEFGDHTFVKIGEIWYDIKKDVKHIKFPVIPKEGNIKKLLARIDEAQS